MTNDVKPRRPYRSTRRAEQSAETRREIVTAAGVLFRDGGYTAVSMPVIAAHGGVGVETSVDDWTLECSRVAITPPP